VYPDHSVGKNIDQVIEARGRLGAIAALGTERTSTNDVCEAMAVERVQRALALFMNVPVEYYVDTGLG
jgi:hypothetical protein